MNKAINDTYVNNVCFDEWRYIYIYIYIYRNVCTTDDDLNISYL